MQDCVVLYCKDPSALLKEVEGASPRPLDYSGTFLHCHFSVALLKGDLLLPLAEICL